MHEYLIQITVTRTVDMTVQAPDEEEAQRLAEAEVRNDCEFLEREAVTVDDINTESTTVEYIEMSKEPGPHLRLVPVPETEAPQ